MIHKSTTSLTVGKLFRTKWGDARVSNLEGSPRVERIANCKVTRIIASAQNKVCLLDALLTLVENDGTESPVRLKILTLRLYDNKEEHDGFEQSSNAEISFRDCTLSVHTEDKKDVYIIVVWFVSSQEGRMIYIPPLYHAMFASILLLKKSLLTYLQKTTTVTTTQSYQRWLHNMIWQQREEARVSWGK